MSSRYFADEKVNDGRQLELDLLKALCVVGMIFTHVLLDLSDSAMPKFVDEYGMEFFGAATFMICMGIGMGYMRNQSPKAYLLRGFGLLTIGQLLNIFRNSVPNLIAWWITGKQFFIANALLILQSDIMSFAGLAFMLMALLKKLRFSDLQILIFSVVLNFLALLSWHYIPSPESYLAMQMMGYFVISDAEASFPVSSAVLVASCPDSNSVCVCSFMDFHLSSTLLVPFSTSSAQVSRISFSFPCSSSSSSYD